MTSQTLTSKLSTYRIAGRAAIASGIVGFVAIGCLITFLATRDKDIYAALIPLRIHDASVAIQFILMIPVIYGIRRLLQDASRDMSRTTVNIAIGALLFTALLLFLDMIKIVSDGLYTVTQGVFGVWLIVISWRMKEISSIWFRLFGMVVGLGLALTGSFSVGYAIFIDVIILRIPAATIEEIQKIPDSPANEFLHKIIWIGFPLGILTLPFWTLLMGRKLLKSQPR